MSEFEEEFNNCLHFGFIPNEPQNKIIEHFKDWQPPKPLVVVPEDVDKAIKYLKKNNDSTFIDLCSILTEKGLNWLNDFQFKDRRFGFGGLNNKLFIISHLAITGYTVDKEQLYYLKNKITNQYINMNPYNGHCHESMTFGNCYKCVFTQSEIDDMETGSYEQIEVKVEEVEK